MDEIEEWFLQEFSHLGFTTTPLMYDPFTYIPIKKVIYNNRITNISISSDLAHDLSYYIDNHIQSYKEMIREIVDTFLNEQRIVFTPNKKIIKFKFT
jgi:hypothetical protein